MANRKRWEELELDRLFQEREEAYEEAIRVEGQYFGVGNLERNQPIRWPKMLTEAAMKEMDIAWEKHKEADRRLQNALRQLVDELNEQ